MATLRQLLDKAFDQRGRNWPIVDLDNINVYCPVEEQPHKSDKFIKLYDSNDEVVATFPLDTELDEGCLWTKPYRGQKEIHFLSVNVLQPISID
jgi:hypothetical protein